MNKASTFKQAYDVTDHEASVILGVSRSNFTDWKNGKLHIPAYIQNSIDLHLEINESHKKRVKEYRL